MLNNKVFLIIHKAVCHHQLAAAAVSGGASPLLKAGHRQVISHITKGSQISCYIILLLPLFTARVAAREQVFLPWHLLWQALVWWCRHWQQWFQFNDTM